MYKYIFGRGLWKTSGFIDRKCKQHHRQRDCENKFSKGSIKWDIDSAFTVDNDNNNTFC